MSADVHYHNHTMDDGQARPFDEGQDEMGMH